MKAHNRARAWALQALYAWEVRGVGPNELVRVLHELSDDLQVSPQNRQYADVLVRLLARHLPRVDVLLREHLTNWSLARLAVVDRNILRLGAVELLYVEEAEPRIVLREAVRLAERYGTPESPRFVHGVLDAIGRSVRPDAERGGP